MRLFILLLSIFGTAIVGACGGGGASEDSTGSGVTDADTVDEYLEAIAPVLDPLVEATDNWSQVADSHAQLDATNLTRSEARVLVEEELDAAREALSATSTALTGIRGVIPPQECEEAHLLVVESLQLSERGFGELIRWMSAAFRGDRVSDGIRERGNDLLNEADLTKTRGLTRSRDCFGQ